MDSKEKDPTNPSYYKDHSIEPIVAIEAWGLDFCLGNAVKYISRAGKKSKEKEIEDLQKAIWYIQRRTYQLGAKPQHVINDVKSNS